MAAMQCKLMCQPGSTRSQSLLLLKQPNRNYPLSRPTQQHRRLQRLQVSANSERSGRGFTTGFILGGVIFGSLGFLFAPQISRALLTEDQKLKLPKFLEEEIRDPEQTKQELSDKIAQLNAAIDEVSSQMKAKDPKTEIVHAEEVTA